MRFPPPKYNYGRAATASVTGCVCVLLIRSSFDSSSAFRPSASAFAAVPSSVVHNIKQSQHSSSESNSAIHSINPLKSLFGNVVSSISDIQQQGMTNISPDKMVELQALIDQVLSSHGIGSWDEIKSKLQAKQTPDEQNFRSNLSKGYGKHSPLHKLRLFDESNNEKDVRVTLYRDSASWCPYCQKVWLTLEQKRIPYRVEKINMRCYGDKPVSFQRMQPSGSIPVAIIDGVTYNQSNDIMYALEEAFPDHEPLVPKDPRQKAKAQELLRLERTLFSNWMSWLTQGDTSNGRLRGYFIATLNDVDTELSAIEGEFFLGEKASIVDFMFAPFLERMCASMLYFKGFQIRVAPGERTDFPAINRWFDAMESLDSYQLTKSDYYSHCWDLPPQLGGCVTETGSKPFQDAINGILPGSWRLPLTPHNGGLEPDWEWAGDEDTAKREAIERLSANHENIVGFASRGAGQAGFPRYGAPLADPNAVPNKSIQPFVDASLKIVADKMIGGVKMEAKTDEAMNALASLLMNEGGKEVVNDVALSLAYLRDRVGVPRDMNLPAARFLRAHLNWARDILG